MLAGEFGTLQVFWSLLFFAGMVLYLWLIIACFGDIVRHPELSGVGKAGWSALVIFVPFVGALIYIVVHGAGMRDRSQGRLNRDLTHGDPQLGSAAWSAARRSTGRW